MAEDHRPPPKDLSHHLSRNVRNRKPSQIKAFYKYFQIPGIGQLAGGLPNDGYFPFDTLEAKVARPDRWQPTPNKPIDDPEAISRIAQLDLSHTTSPSDKAQDTITVPHTSAQSNPLRRVDLATALQYGTAQGYPPLYYFVRQFTRDHLHPNCPYKGGPEVILTCGNTDGLSKALLALTDEWDEQRDWIRDRDALLVEEFAYTNAFQTAEPRGMALAPVKIDDEGMLAEGPGGLREILENWDLTKGRRPRLMYTVTMGHNPTSAVLSLARRREIYALCSKYDVIIIEDDPYAYLQYPSAVSRNAITKTSTPTSASGPVFANSEPVPENWKSTGYDFLDSLVPSYISIDTDGRVLRLETFSKTIAPGCRAGWITAQPEFINRLLSITETSTQQPSGFVQSMIAELVLGPDHNGIKDRTLTKPGRDNLPDSQGWKADGWVRWLEGLRGNYERRMNIMCQILHDRQYAVKSGRRPSFANLVDETSSDPDGWSVIEKTRLYSFVWPVGGMFVWLRVHFETHPCYASFAKTDEQALLARALWLFWTTKPYLVLVGPGAMFSPTPAIAARDGWRYFRLCFAAIDEDQLTRSSEGLAKGVAAFWRIKDRQTIEKIINDDADSSPMAVDGDGGDIANLARLVGPC